jgi:hypothetical protein
VANDGSAEMKARIGKIGSILVEESVASYLSFHLGVTLEGEARTIDLVRSSDHGAEDLPGYMLGIAPEADPESISRATRRIIDEVT